jgi:hypothetical protein
MVSATHSVGYERTKIIERLVGPTFKTGQGSVMITLSHKTTKSAESFDDHTFEDEGDASLGKTIKETHDGPKPWHFTQSREGPIPMCDGDAFWGFGLRRSYVHLIRIEPCLRGAIVGDVERSS